MTLKKYFNPFLPSAIRLSVASLTLASSVAIPFTAWPEDPLPPIDPIWNKAKIEPERRKKSQKSVNEATRATIGTSVKTDPEENSASSMNAGYQNSTDRDTTSANTTNNDDAITTTFEEKESIHMNSLSATELEALQSEVVKPENFPTYIKAAEAGDPEGMRLAGICYLYGTGTNKDERKAWDWIGKAASAGDTEAQYDLGCLYRDGTGVKQNYTESAYWFRRAARNGNSKAMINIARQFAEGKGVLQDYRIAAENFRRAAERGEAEGMYHYAVMLRDGIGVNTDRKKALRWFEEAAKLDYKDSKSQAEELRKSVSSPGKSMAKGSRGRSTPGKR